MLACLILTVLVLVLKSTRQPCPDGWTPAQLGRALRSQGWRAPFIVAGILAAALALAAGGLLIVAFDGARHLAAGTALFADLAHRHLCDLLGWQPLTLWGTR
ncbi:hypothetical protein [Microbispora sp. ATCC PTA-5024]|uniref:hypothetical protein n=1 Tax=Microbispora sp. ATCC PTA-5024 TaxID=316330 RepID=UPI0012ED08EC|nr:hypothetical protein [Microbispora sp. ATCC PTA-5024]